MSVSLIHYFKFALLQIYKVRPPSIEVSEQYNTLNDCIPPALLRSAVVPNTEDELKALASTYVGDRQGMANTRDHQSHEGDFFLLRTLLYVTFFVS